MSVRKVESRRQQKILLGAVIRLQGAQVER
jgi:ribosome-associated protein YbcJ (S4-like RNA binding protein)